jgi:hypothetical protein
MPDLTTEMIDLMEPLVGNRSDRRRPLGHKLAQIGAAIMVGAVAITAWAANPGRDGPQRDVTLLYVGADDCAPCRAWRRGDGATFLASTEFARITYREVRSPHLEDVMNDANWPEDVRDYRNRIRRSDGVPLWLVITDRTVVDQQFGTAAWRERILPTVRSYLR